ANGSRARLIEHFVRDRVERGRDGDAERVGGLAADRKVELRLLDRQVARSRALEYPIHERGGAAIELPDVFAVAHQSADLNEFALRIDRRQAVPERLLGKFLLLHKEISIVRNDDCLDALAGEPRERAVDTLRVAGVGPYQRNA